MSYNLLGKLAVYGGRLRSLSPRGVPRRGLLRASSCWLAPLALCGCLTKFPPLLQGEDTAETTDETTTSVDTTAGTSVSNSETVPPDAGPATDASVDASDSGDTSSSSDGSGATSSSSTTVLSCGPGETVCGSECVRGNSCCETKCEAPNAEGECRDEECVVVSCADDFVDCDGEFDNGCELPMPTASAPQATEASPFEIPRFDFDGVVSEIDQANWDGVPRFNLSRACTTCESDGPPQEPDGVPPLTFRGASPTSSDFRGSFALAWNDLGLWVNVVAVDDQWVTGDDVGVTGAHRYDNVMVVWDSAAGESDTGSGDDRILFAGIDGELTDWRQSSFSEASVRVLGSGQCRSIHLHLGGEYLFSGSGGGSFEVGERHGLNIGYNDFDLLQEDARAVERQHLVFGLPMTFTSGRDYFNGTRTLPQIELTAP